MSESLFTTILEYRATDHLLCKIARFVQKATPTLLRMKTGKKIQPDNTAVRTALWRALHIQADAIPHVLEDEIGLTLIAPEDDWQERPDMKYTKRLRASIVARSRFIEDTAKEQIEKGVNFNSRIDSDVCCSAQDWTVLPRGIQK